MLKRKIKQILFFIYRLKINLFCKTVKIEPHTCISKATKFEGYNVIGENTFFKGSIGKYSYIGANCNISADIGRFCSISRNVQTLNAVHPSKKFVSIHPIFYSTARQCGTTFVDKNTFDEYVFYDKDCKIACKIGNDVWIGCGAIIMGGISIGDGAIIAAGAVVTKNVSPYSIVGGVPAKEISKRFDVHQIASLCEFKWWNKDESWLRDHIEDFQNIEFLMKAMETGATAANKEQENKNF